VSPATVMGLAQRGPFWCSKKKTVLVEESPMASVPPLGSAGSTGPQGPPGRGYEIYPTWLPAAGCRPSSGRSPLVELQRGDGRFLCFAADEIEPLAADAPRAARPSAQGN
jgi:hypothetical protein